MKRRRIRLSKLDIRIEVLHGNRSKTRLRIRSRPLRRGDSARRLLRRVWPVCGAVSFAYVWSEGLAAAWHAWGRVLGFAGVRLVDRAAGLVRQNAGVAAIGLVYVLYRFIFRRFGADRRPQLALLLERRFRDFDESLLTTVETGRAAGPRRVLRSQMLAHCRHAAIDRLAGVRVGDVFRRGPLVRSLSGAAAAIVSGRGLGLAVRRTSSHLGPARAACSPMSLAAPHAFVDRRLRRPADRKSPRGPT